MKSKILKWYERNERTVHAILDMTCDAIPGAGVIKGALDILHKVDLDDEDIVNQEKIKEVEVVLEKLKGELGNIVGKIEQIQAFQAAGSLEQQKNVIKNNNQIYRTLNPLIPELGNIIVTSLTGKNDYRINSNRDYSNETLCNGKYILKKHIATGGQGSVYQGVNTYVDRQVAIKLLPEEFSSNTHGINILKKDYTRLVDKLTHPHIVQYRNIDYTDELNRWFITLDYIEGKTLRDLIYEKQKKPFNHDEVYQYLAPISKALQHAHAQGIVHCDVKPENILVDNKQNSFLTDFGLSQEVQSMISLSGAESNEKHIQGTLPYMAPEQYKGWAPRKETDTWAVGVILYEMLTGRNPFYGRSFEHYKEIICNGTPEPIENNKLWTILKPFFEKKYRQRDVNILKSLELIRSCSSYESVEVSNREEKKLVKTTDQDLKEEERMLKKAKQGSVKNMVDLANYYEELNKHNLALPWYEKASEKGDVGAMMKLGGYYEHGTGTAKDLQRAISIYEKAFERGVNQAAVNLIYIYASENEIEQDLGLAAYWYRHVTKSTKNKKIIEKVDELFNMYLHDYIENEKKSTNVTPKETDKELKSLGDRYTREGKLREAQETYARLKFDSYPQIALQVAANYFSGTHTKKNTDKAYEIYRKGVEKSMPKAYGPLIKIYISKGKSENYDKALAIYHEFMKLSTSAQEKKEVTSIYKKSLKSYESSKKNKENKKDQGTAKVKKNIENKKDQGTAKVKKNIEKKVVSTIKTPVSELENRSQKGEKLMHDEMEVLGRYYVVEKKNYKKAYEIFNQIDTKKENTEYLHEIATYFATSWFSRDWAKVAQIYEKGVKANIGSFYVPLMDLYISGHGGKKGTYDALELYYKLMDQGNPECKKEIREFYNTKLKKAESIELERVVEAFNEGFNKPINKIEMLYKRHKTFPLTSFPELILALGELYLHKKNVKNAKKVYEEGVNDHVPEAYAPLMRMYINGKAGEKSLEEALQLYNELKSIGVTKEAKSLYRMHLLDFEKAKKKLETYDNPGYLHEIKKRKFIYKQEVAVILGTLLALGMIYIQDRKTFQNNNQETMSHYDEQVKRGIDVAIDRTFMKLANIGTYKHTEYIYDQLKKEMKKHNIEDKVFENLMKPYNEYKKTINYRGFSKFKFITNYRIYENKIKKIGISNENLFLSLPYLDAIENYHGENYNHETNKSVKEFYLGTVYEYARGVKDNSEIGLKATTLNTLGRLSQQLFYGSQSNPALLYRKKIIYEYMNEFNRIYKTLSQKEKQLKLVELGVFYTKKIPRSYR